MMNQSWMERVSHYLDSLEACVEALNDTLDETRVGTTSLDGEQVGEGTRRLTLCLQDLERLIGERKELLDAEDVPFAGVSLRDILNRSSDPSASELAKRCGKLSHEVDMSRERAVALFVCQFHLGDLSNHLLAILRSGTDHGSTYERGKLETKRAGVAGSIFNKAA
jgi:hypothetical protein